MKELALSILAMLALTLTGCERHKINEGVVVDMSMTPTYTSFIHNGKFMIPIVYPASYRVSVKDKDIVETFHVSEDKYLTLRVGDSISFTDSPCREKEYSNLLKSDNGLSVARGNGVKVRGGIGALLVIAEENKDNCNIAQWKAAVVDGSRIKADTWYKLVDGEFTEAKEQ